jgi:tetratricopeptide (TPR) repeat protein
LGAVCALVIGFYAWIAESGTRELSPSEAQDNYYNLLVRGFRSGQLNVSREVPPEVIHNRDPENIKWLEGHGLFDLSYYKGKVYLYFGVTPALVLFWPYAALTGHYLPHKDAVTIFLTVGFLAGMGLLCAVWRRYFKETSVWTVAAGMLAMGLANFAPTMLGRGDVYEVPISCGYALTMLAMAGVWGAMQDGRRRWLWLAGASLAYGLALGARPSLLFGAVILLVPVAKAWREQRRVWPLLLAAGGPIVVIGLGLMIYNTLRFENPLEFGQRYQLPLRDHQQFSLRYFWFNFRVAFLEPAQWGGHLPFVHDIASPAAPKGYDIVDHAFGILTNIPLVWLALAAPLAWRNRSLEERSMLRWFLGAVAFFFGMCALLLCLHDSMCVRYEMELAAPLVLLAVIGLLAMQRALAGQPVWRRAARCGWGLLLAFSTAFNLCLTFEAQADLDCGIGSALLRNGRVDEAIAQYRKALQFNPGYMEARFNLGSALVLKGNLDEAAAQYRKVLEIRPDYLQAEYSLGKVLLQKGDVDEAMAHLDKTATVGQDPFEKWYNFGNQFLQEPDWQCAIACYRQAIKIAPRSADAYANLGVAFLKKGETREAIDAWQQALEMKPDQLYVLNNLAWLLATTPDASLRDGAKAVALAAQANQLSGGGNPAILRTLAAAYAEEGSYSMAAVTARRGLELATGQKDDALTATLQKEIQLYEAGKPAREAPP